VLLKSRGCSARRRQNDNENCNYAYPADYFGDVMCDVNGSSNLAGKYALYRPRPGKNVSPARTQIGKAADEEGKGMNKAHPVNEDNSSATCPPSSELTYIRDNIDRASISSSLSLIRTELSHILLTSSLLYMLYIICL